MNVRDKIAASTSRPIIDQGLMEGVGYVVISQRVRETGGEIFEPEAIEDYHIHAFKRGDSTVHQIIRMTQNIDSGELPANNSNDKLSTYFSFAKTTEDLDMIYDRIRELRVAARANPEQSSYDRRIKDYLAQAESIRNRVFRHQYENIRRAVLMTVGKKICLAAVSILIPYVNREKKQEALRRFQAAIEPLLDPKIIPSPPSDMAACDDEAE